MGQIAKKFKISVPKVWNIIKRRKKLEVESIRNNQDIIKLHLKTEELLALVKEIELTAVEITNSMNSSQ